MDESTVRLQVSEWRRLSTQGKTKDEVIEQRVRKVFPYASVAPGEITIANTPVNFESLMKLSEALGTMKFVVKGYSEVTDWSEYSSQDDDYIAIKYNIADVPDSIMEPNG